MSLDERLEGLEGNESSDTEVGDDIVEGDGMMNGDDMVGGEDAMDGQDQAGVVELAMSGGAAANTASQSMRSSGPSPGDRLLERSRSYSFCSFVP